MPTLCGNRSVSLHEMRRSVIDFLAPSHVHGTIGISGVTNQENLRAMGQHIDGHS